MEPQHQSKKIVIVSPSLNFLGGAQRACLHAISALRKTNCKISLATVDKTDWVLVEKIFGSISKPDEELYFFSRMPERLTGTLKKAFTAFFYVLQLFRIMKGSKHSLVINMGGEIADNLGNIVYVNAIPLRLMRFFPGILPNKGNRWKSYTRLFSSFLRFLDNDADVVIANSKFTQSVIREFLGKQTLVIYPPVESSVITSQVNCRTRKNAVITISRFRSAKELEIIPKIAANVKNCEFIVVGTADKESEHCLKKLNEQIETLAVENRVHVFSNKPYSFTLAAMSAATIFLHTQSTEAFGMSIVESMAAGCVPIVPRKGGPWIDILDCQEGKYGFSYENPSEAANKINLLLNNEGLRRKVSAHAMQRALAFDRPIFEKKLLSLAEKTLADSKRSF